MTDSEHRPAEDGTCRSGHEWFATAYANDGPDVTVELGEGSAGYMLGCSHRDVVLTRGDLRRMLAAMHAAQKREDVFRKRFPK